MNTTYHVRNASTAACEVRVRMTHEQYAEVKAFYGKPENYALRFATSEVYSAGNGWYVIYGDDEHVDAALRGLSLIRRALEQGAQIRAERERRLERERQEAEAVGRAYSGKRRLFVIVRQVKIRGRVQCKAYNRALSAARNKDAEMAREIRRLMQPAVESMNLAKFAAKFNAQHHRT